MNLRLALAVAAVVVAVTTAAFLWRPAGTVAVEPVPDGFVEALAVHGYRFDPAPDPAAAARAAGLSPSAAVEAALGEFGEAREGTPHVYLGTLTVDDLRTAGGARQIEDRAVFAVRFTGLRLPPVGMPATDDTLHEELVVFLDASSGEWLVATTVR